MRKITANDFPDGMIYWLLRFLSMSNFENPVSLDDLHGGLKFRGIDANNSDIRYAIKYLKSIGLKIYGNEIIGYYWV